MTHKNSSHRTLCRPRLEALEDRFLPAFGTGGIVLTDVAATSGEWIQSTALQADGKIVVAGNVGLARYDSGGALDVTFNGGGSQPGVITSTGTYFNAVAVQADGKILVAGRTTGTSDDSFLLRRYSTAGAPDTTFGTGGSVTTTFTKGRTDEVAAIAIQADQKIIAVGFANAGGGTSRNWAVVRYNTNGTLDTTFNRTGKVIGFDKSNSYHEAKSVVVQPDQKIVVVGRAVGPDGYLDFALARYNTDGTLDSTFDSDGKVLTDFQSEYPGWRSEDSAYDVALQTDGKIVVAGRANGPDDFAVARYNPNGSLDATFAGDGKLLVVPPFALGGHFFKSVALQADGKIVLGGSSGLACVARLLPGGTLDSSFDGDGWQIFQYEPPGTDFTPSWGNDLALQPDGKVLIVGGHGYLSDDPTTKFALARLNADGSFDAGAPLGAGGSSGGLAAERQGRETALDLAFEGYAGQGWYGLGLLLEQLQKKR